jgi:Domain of unknown function (DU1801)
MPAPTTVKEYLESLPDERKQAILEIRKVINKRIPKGFSEGIAYGMIGWSVPHSTFPAGYHCDPSKPLMLMSLASQKGGISLHHLGMYVGPLVEWFKKEWPKHSTKKLDMGKACIRFKKFEDVPLDLIGELASKLTPRQWVEQYQKALTQRPAK